MIPTHIRARRFQESPPHSADEVGRIVFGERGGDVPPQPRNMLVMRGAGRQRSKARTWLAASITERIRKNIRL